MKDVRFCCFSGECPPVLVAANAPAAAGLRLLGGEGAARWQVCFFSDEALFLIFYHVAG